MSELKAFNCVESDLQEFCEPRLVYLKSEADNVIAEKDAEIARLKDIRKVHIEAIESMGAGLLQDYDEIRRQKYKRCLAMAQVLEHVCPMTNRKAKWRDKWRQRWLELTDKLKEAK